MPARRRLPPLLPEPQRVRARPGAFALREGLPVVLAPESGAADFATARALREGIRAATGVRLAVETHARREGLGPHVALRREGEEGEAYRLRVERGGVEAVGAGPAGLRYAAETLRQLASPERRIPACEVEDAPGLAFRGLLLDVSRGKVPTEATLRWVVDLCARLKLNALLLYTEHTFRFRRHPRIGEGAAPLDAETLRALDGYAAERFVELVPCLQSLGHMGHVLKHARYRPLAESEALWTLSPADPGTYELLRDLYDEYLPNFRSRLFHANCDEPFDLGRGRSREREEELGPGDVYVEHLRRVRELARERGRRTLVWADMLHRHPERLEELPRDLVLLDWWYEAECDYERVRSFRQAGFDFVVCPGTSSWNALFPRVPNALENVARWARTGRRYGARGLLCTDWGDFGHYNLQGSSLLAFAWAAQQAWSGDAAPERFDRAFGRALFGERRGRVASCYRALGAVHDAGFPVANGSAFQFLFFDDLERAFFLQQARRGALRRALPRLERAAERLRAAEADFAREPLVRSELLFGAEATAFAARKALAALEWLDARRHPARWSARERRALARRLRALASEQTRLGRELRRLWSARSRSAGFEISAARLRASVTSLRRAARALERGRLPPPPPAAAEVGIRTIFAELRALAEAHPPPERRGRRAQPRR